jgi:RTX calcium-binding nonapeptide repeat (4 copies)
MRAVLIALVLAPFALAAGVAPARPNAAGCKHEIRGTAAPEALDGTPGNDRILGFAGDDRLTGQAGNDCLNGGFDSDQLNGNAGDDILRGSNGDDVLMGDAGADDLMGEQDADRLSGGTGSDRLWGGGGGDVLSGDAGADVLRGQGGNDRLAGGAGPDKLFGGAGNDTITEEPPGYVAGQPLDTASNRVDGGPGRDTIDVANGRRDTVECGSGVDSVKADKGDRLRHCEHRRLLISPFPAVTPARGKNTRTFVIEFRSLQAVGPKASWFGITVKGPPGCSKIDASSYGVAYHRDRAVRYRLHPFGSSGKMAKRWCFGRYTGKVSFVPRMGPIVDVGRFSFRVHG